jgi:SAM-dependent methyltransferase
MRQEEIWDAETAQRYDTPGSGMFAPEVLEPVVNYLAKLTGNGRALEFAIGTGRVAVPLARRGIPVSGIELSRPMVEKLRTKADEAAIPVVIGDMATARAPGEYTLVYLVYNTISNLLSQAEQVACFRNAARHLSPGGRFVIELWVPELRKLPPGQSATVYHVEPGYIGLDTYDVVQQHVVSHHFRFGEDRRAELFRSPHRYIWPAELDLMAQLAGFELEARHADWVGTEFTAESQSHVSA